MPENPSNQELNASETPSENGNEQSNTDNNATPEEPQTTIINMAFYHNERLNAAAIKTKGFLLTQQHDEHILKNTLSSIDDKYKALDQEFRTHQKQKIDRLNEQLNRVKERLKETQARKITYETFLEELPQQQKVITEQINQLQERIYALLKIIGKEKQNIVSTSLTGIEAELKKIIEISRNIQNDQNSALEKEHNQDNSIKQKRIEFWTDILTKYQAKHDAVVNRLRLLARDGITYQTARLFIFLGIIAAMVSGWWFAIWTGPLPDQQTTDNISGNSGVRFFVLDKLSRFLSAFTLQELFIDLLVYLGSVALLSLVCYGLLRWLGFAGKPGQKSKNAKNGQEENYELDTEDEENILKAQLKSNVWLAFWLRLMPFLFAFLPVLAIISKQTVIDQSANARNATDFQGLFDSLVNQLVGTSLAIAFSVFAILYLTRVEEKKYHDNNNGQNTRRNNRILYAGFILFGFMILGMLLHQYIFPFFNDIRRIALLGFVVSTLTVGFSLGYGYLFLGLQKNAGQLLYDINRISIIISNLSRPYRVNYTSNGLLRERIYLLQQKMFDVVEGRHNLATVISSGFQSVPYPKSKPPKVEQADKQPPIRRFFTFFWKGRWFAGFQEKQDDKKEAQGIQHNMSPTELKYFSESSEQLEELNANMKELKNNHNELKDLQQEKWRNEGTYKSLNTQIENIEAEIKLTEEEKDAVNEETIAGSQKIAQRCDQEKTLLQEGYFTGNWYKENGKNNGNHLLGPTT